MAEIPEGGESSKARTPVSPIDPRTGTVSSRGWSEGGPAAPAPAVIGESAVGGGRGSEELKRL